MRRLVLASLLLLGGAAAAQDAAPAPDLDPALKRLEVLVGGRWETEQKGPTGLPFAQNRFAWAPDGKSILGTAIIGQGTARPLHATVRIGWDPVAKQVYYLDAHGSETVYFGHVRWEGEVAVYRFKTLVGTPGEWEIRETFPDGNTLKSDFRKVVDGRPAEQGFTLVMKRTR